MKKAENPKNLVFLLNNIIFGCKKYENDGKKGGGGTKQNLSGGN